MADNKSLGVCGQYKIKPFINQKNPKPKGESNSSVSIYPSILNAMKHYTSMKKLAIILKIYCMILEDIFE